MLAARRFCSRASGITCKNFKVTTSQLYPRLGLNGSRTLASSSVTPVVGGANLDWGNLVFQYVDVNSHMRYTWKEGSWDDGLEVDKPFMKTHVMANVFHYGQAIFEGLKVFHCSDGCVRVFNDAANHRRMMHGCRRMGMPSISLEMFQAAIDRAVQANVDFIPPYGSNGALYVRPFLIGSGHQLGLGASNEYTFMVVVAPVGSYYKSSKLAAIECCVMDDFDRAAPLGVGGVKAAGNYAADICPSAATKERGFPIGLYLDAKEHKYVEEFNTSNFVGITADNRFVTPDSTSVLPSITNECLQLLAAEEGMIVEKRPIDFDSEAANFIEVGAVGTAVVITPIASITRGQTKYEYKGFQKLQSLHDKFRRIQNGEVSDRYGWTRTIDIGQNLEVREMDGLKNSSFRLQHVPEQRAAMQM